MKRGEQSGAAWRSATTVAVMVAAALIWTASARAAAPVYTDAAHSGDWYGTTSTTSPGGGVYQDINMSTGAGQTVCASAWVRSDYPFTGASGTFAVWLIGGGSAAENGSAGYGGLGNLGNWTELHACAEATTAHSQVRIQFYPSSGSPAVDMDDIDVHRSLAVNGGFEDGGTGWAPWPNAGSNFSVYAAAASPGNPPHSGGHFGATNAAQPGGGIYQDVSLSTSPGQLVCGSAWVRTEASATGASGSFALWLLGNTPNESSTARYSGLGNGNNWTQLHTCVEATGAHSTLRIQFYPTPGSPTVEIDDVDVHESIVPNGGFEYGSAPWGTYPGTNSTYSTVRTHNVLGPVVTTPQPVALPKPKGKHVLKVRMSISWTYRYAITRWDKSSIGRFPGGTRLRVQCLGRRCSHKAIVATGRKRIKRLLHKLRGRRYRVGQRLRLTLSAPHWKPEKAQITFRYARLPRARLL